MGVSSTVMARLLGVDQSAVVKAAKQGRISKDADGKYDPPTVMREWYENTDLSHGRNPFTGSPKGFAADEANGKPANSIGKSRAAYEAFRALLLQLEYQKKSGALVPVEDMKRTVFEGARRCRERLLTIPDRIAPILTGMDDADAIHAMLTEEITNALRELSGYQGDEE